MQSQDARPRLALAPLVTLILLASAQQLQAQTGGEGGGRPRPAGPARPTRAMSPPGHAESELIMREMEREAAKPPAEAAAAKLPLAQIAADFARMQVVNNRMMGAAMSSGSPDYRLIAEANAEIGKCASRLKANLPLPEPEKEEGEAPTYRRPEDAAQLKAALLLLDRSLMSFVKNPVFKNTGVVDAKDGARARRDLERVIELSRRIGKDAGRLAKDAGKN